MSQAARRLPLPTTGSERRLILAARGGDATAQARVLSQYEPMMRLIARRLYLPGGEADALAQEARLGLVEAMRTWDPYRGVPFSNFAWLCATRDARNAVVTARTAKHHLLTTAAPLDRTAGSATEGDLPAEHRAAARRRVRVRPAGTPATAGATDLD